VQDVEQNDDESKKRFVVEMKWKGQKGIALRRSAKRNFTEEGGFCGDGVFEWNEEFKSVCNLSGNKDGVFLPWEIAFAVFSVSFLFFSFFSPALVFVDYLLVDFLSYRNRLLSLGFGFG
jgi:hypothetical protein